jgi:DnaJ like chaperone protein
MDKLGIFGGKKAARYFESPGKVDFNEGVAGLSAYCALATLLAALSVRADESTPLLLRRPSGKDKELILRQAAHSAQEAFPGSGPALVKTFCKIALSMTDRLNPDLLAESLAARRAGAGDLERLGQALESLAEGDRALREAASIRQILAPFYAGKLTSVSRN